MSSFAYSSKWYVNDGSTTGDIYCSAIGNNANSGTAASPFATVSYVISNKTLSAGDIVYIDGGTYNEQWTLNSNADGGSSGNPVLFQGAGISLSKNVVTGASDAVYIGNGSAAGNSYITITNMYFETQNSSYSTVYVSANTTNIIFNTCSFKNICSTGYCVNYYQTTSCRVMFSTLSSSGHGVGLYYGSNHIVDGNTITMTNKVPGNTCGVFLNGTGAGAQVADNCTISSNKISGGNYGLDIQGEGTGNLWKNNYIWNCDYGIYADNGGTDHPSNTFKFNSLRTDKNCMKGDFNSWTIKNNIFYLVGGTGYYCMYMNDASHDPTTSNYNLYYYPTSGGQAGYRNGTSYAAVAANWKNVFNSNEANSLVGDPDWSSSTVLDLTASSPAINVAVTDATVTDDVRRNPSYIRPNSNQDIGAYEYNATLPIELIQFKVSYNPDGNLLNWITASEINNNFFTLERSYDGILYEPFENIKGAGNSSVQISYAAKDPLVFDGTVYYRLKQTDYNGAFTYSKIVSVSNKQNERLNMFIYPNPSSGQTVFSFSSQQSGAFPFVIYDLSGKKVYSATIAGIIGENKFELNLSDLENSVYYVNIILDENNSSTSKFIKID